MTTVVRHKPLTANQRQRRAEFAWLVQSLAPRKPSAFNCHMVSRPYNVKRGTGAFGSV